MRTLRFAAYVSVVTIILMCSGCTSVLLSDDRLKANVAGALSESPQDVTITNRNEQGTNTYVTATTKSGTQYACIVNGGGILAAGMVNPPICNKKGEPPKSTSPFQTR